MAYFATKTKMKNTINRENRHGSWRKCKYLGTLLDTKCDITRRKILSTEALKSLNDIWINKLTITIKIKIFDCLIPEYLHVQRSVVDCKQKQLPNK